MFKHFENRTKAKKYITTADRLDRDHLVIRKKHGKHAKPYAVATPLVHLHFTPDSWVKKRKRR